MAAHGQAQQLSLERQQGAGALDQKRFYVTNDSGNAAREPRRTPNRLRETRRQS